MMYNDWTTNYGAGRGGGGGDIKQYGKRSIQLNIDLRLIEDEENMKQYTDSEKSTGNPSSSRSALAPPLTRARTTPRLANRDPNIIIPPVHVEDGAAPTKSIEDVASRKTKAIQNTSKNSRVRLNSNETVEGDSPAADIDKRRAIPICGRLTRSTSCRTVPSNPNNLKMAVAGGHRDDVDFLLHQIDSFMAVTVSGWFEFCFHLPPWHESALSRLRIWLESVGFEEIQAGKYIFRDHHNHAIMDLRNLLSDRLTHKSPIGSRGRSTSLVDDDRKKFFSQHLPSALLPPAYFPHGHGLQISIPTNFMPIEQPLSNVPTPRSAIPTPRSARSNAPTPRSQLPGRSHHVRQSSNAQSLSSLIEPPSAPNLSNRFRRDDGSVERTDSPFGTEPGTPKSIGQKSPFGYSGPNTASTSSTHNTLHCRRQSSPLEYSFINQFSQSNLMSSDDNALPIVRQNSYGSASTSTQSDDNSLNENFRNITTADPNLLGDSQGTDYDYLPHSAQDSYLPIEPTLKICDDSLKCPGPGHDSDLYESDSSTVKDFSFISEGGDVFHGDPQPFLEPPGSHLQSTFKKSNSFADCPVAFEVELKGPNSEQDLNDLDSFSWGIPPRNIGHYPIPQGADRSENISDYLRDGPAVSPQLAARGLYDDDRSSYGICNGDEIKFISKIERDSKESLRTGYAVNSKKKQARRSISDSAMRSSVSSVPESLPAGVHPGSVTPGPVSLSQNAADSLDPQRATYYQTPQAIRSKFESSKPASPKEIEFLLKLLEMVSGQEDSQLGDTPHEFSIGIPLIPPIMDNEIVGKFGIDNRSSGVTFENGTYHESENCLFDLKYSENARKLSMSTSFSGGKSLVHAASSPSLSDMFYDCHSNRPEASSGSLRRSGSNSAVDDALSCVRSLSMKRCKSLPSGFTDSCDNSLIMEQNSNHMDTSIHSNSNTFLGTEVGFYSCDEEATGPDEAGSRKDKKKRMSILKYGRMSVKRMNGRDMQPSSNGFSPSAMSKICWQRRRRAQAGNVSREDVTPYAISRMDHDSSLDHSHQNHSRLMNFNISADAHSIIEDVSKSTDDSHMHLSHSELNEHTFMGTVIGGVYQHCFDEQRPVVAPPSNTESRVVGLRFTTVKAIMLQLFVPKRNKIDNVEFSVDWKCIRASPTGFLLTEKSHMRDYRHAVYYYIPKHPYDWSAENDQRSASGFEICMESRPFHIPNVEGIHQPFSHEQDDDDDDGYGMHMELEIPMETKMDTCAEWCNSSIMRMVLEYLVDAGPTTVAGAPPALKGPPAAKSDSRKGSRRQNGASQDSESLRSKHAIGALEGFTSATGGGQDASFFSQCKPYYSVCKAWALSIHMLSAQRLSDIVDCPSSLCNFEKWSKFVSSHAYGDFLGDGACKNVYAVKENTAAESRVIAVSVMDVNKLVDEGMDCAIRQELEISMLCSSLMTLNICPNLVRIYSMFQSEYPAPEFLWNSGNVLGSGGGTVASAKSVALPSKSMMSKSKGKYQFFCMEFCSGGDIEGMIRKEKSLDFSIVRSFLFQMCFALYTCREKLSLRHFDIKLLNFLATRGSSIVPQGSSNTSAGETQIDLQVGFGKHIYSLPLRSNEHSLVKLADFGTSIIGEKCLGDNINKMQFTTLENTPPEFLLLGSTARQCFSSDTFPLGLCFFHLLTGHQPYEELMRNVHCPAYLASKLAELWYTEDAASPYLVIREVIVSILPLNAQMTKNSGAVLFDTLYRYMVLVGHSFSEDVSSKRGSSPLTVSACSAYSSSVVWAAVVEALGLALDDDVMEIIISEKRSVQPTQRFSKEDISSLRNMEREKKECLKQYKKDLGKWSIRSGEDKKMISLRSRLSALGSGAAQLLESMLHFDPSKRCTMHDALNSSVFHKLRSDLVQPFKYSSSGYVGNTSDSVGSASYMHYYRPGDSADGFPDSLPIL